MAIAQKDKGKGVAAASGLLSQLLIYIPLAQPLHLLIKGPTLFILTQKRSYAVTQLPPGAAAQRRSGAAIFKRLPCEGNYF
jgi:hypothetical protein